MLEIKKYCHCKPSEFSNLPEPLFRIICHCKTCQKFNGQPYNDECTFWYKDCSEINVENVDFKSYQSRLSPLKRGMCKFCGKVAYSIAKIGPLAHLVMVSSERLGAQKRPDPSAHVYYDRRVSEADDRIKKVSGHVLSQAVIQWAILKSVIKSWNSA